MVVDDPVVVVVVVANNVFKTVDFLIVRLRRSLFLLLEKWLV